MIAAEMDKSTSHCKDPVLTGLGLVEHMVIGAVQIEYYVAKKEVKTSVLIWYEIIFQKGRWEDGLAAEEEY